MGTVYHPYNHKNKVYYDVIDSLHELSINYPNVENYIKLTEVEMISLIEDACHKLPWKEVDIVLDVINGSDIKKCNDGEKFSNYYFYKRGIKYIAWYLSHRNDPDCVTNLIIPLRYMSCIIYNKLYSIKELSGYSKLDFEIYPGCGKGFAKAIMAAIKSYMET